MVIRTAGVPPAHDHERAGRVLDLAAQMAADLVELDRLADLQAARPDEGDADVLDDAAGPPAHHQHAVGEIDGLADGMGDEQRGAVVLLPHLHQHQVHLVARDGIQRAERLVHQQQVGLVDQGATDGDALAHAAGELARLVMVEAAEADLVEQVGGPRARRRIGRAS
jgi:hypothetical protein